MNHGNKYGDESPGNQNAGNPPPGAPALHDKRSGNFKQEVASKKDARAQAEYAIGETQIVGHLQACKAHVNPIQICDEVKYEQKRQESPRDTAPGSLPHV